MLGESSFTLGEIYIYQPLTTWLNLHDSDEVGNRSRRSAHQQSLSIGMLVSGRNKCFSMLSSNSRSLNLCINSSKKSDLSQTRISQHRYNIERLLCYDLITSSPSSEKKNANKLSSCHGQKSGLQWNIGIQRLHSWSSNFIHTHCYLWDDIPPVSDNNNKNIGNRSLSSRQSGSYAAYVSLATNVTCSPTSCHRMASIEIVKVRGKENISIIVDLDMIILSAKRTLLSPYERCRSRFRASQRR